MHNKFATAADRYKSEINNVVSFHNAAPQNTAIAASGGSISHGQREGEGDKVEQMNNQQSMLAHSSYSSSPPVKLLNEFYLQDSSLKFQKPNYKQSPYSKKLTTSKMYQGQQNLNKEDQLEWNEDGLGRHMPGNGTAGKLGSLNIPQKRQLAQRQQRAIYGQAQ